jgi:hypothetical protein
MMCKINLLLQCTKTSFLAQHSVYVVGGAPGALVTSAATTSLSVALRSGDCRAPRPQMHMMGHGVEAESSRLTIIIVI